MVGWYIYVGVKEEESFSGVNCLSCMCCTACVCMASCVHKRRYMYTHKGCYMSWGGVEFKEPGSCHEEAWSLRSRGAVMRRRGV